MELAYARSRDFFRTVEAEERVREYLDPLREHHRETHGHSLRVGLLCVDLGIDEAFGDEDLRMLAYAGLLHDVGKLRIAGEILSKKTGLDPAEQELMGSHPRLGFLVLEKFEYNAVRQITVAHHEYKKHPYPRKGAERRRDTRTGDRRAGDSLIPVMAQIVAVADIFDALVNRRAYKPALPRPEVERIFREQFIGDPVYVQRVLERLPPSR